MRKYMECGEAVVYISGVYLLTVMSTINNTVHLQYKIIQYSLQYKII